MEYAAQADYMALLKPGDKTSQQETGCFLFCLLFSPHYREQINCMFKLGS